MNKLLTILLSGLLIFSSAYPDVVSDFEQKLAERGISLPPVEFQTEDEDYGQVYKIYADDLVLLLTELNFMLEKYSLDDSQKQRLLEQKAAIIWKMYGNMDKSLDDVINALSELNTPEAYFRIVSLTESYRKIEYLEKVLSYPEYVGWHSDAIFDILKAEFLIVPNDMWDTFLRIAPGYTREFYNNLIVYGDKRAVKHQLDIYLVSIDKSKPLPPYYINLIALYNGDAQIKVDREFKRKGVNYYVGLGSNMQSQGTVGLTHVGVNYFNQTNSWFGHSTCELDAKAYAFQSKQRGYGGDGNLRFDFKDRWFGFSAMATANVNKDDRIMSNFIAYFSSNWSGGLGVWLFGLNLTAERFESYNRLRNLTKFDAELLETAPSLVGVPHVQESRDVIHGSSTELWIPDRDLLTSATKSYKATVPFHIKKLDMEICGGYTQHSQEFYTQGEGVYFPDNGSPLVYAHEAWQTHHTDLITTGGQIATRINYKITLGISGHYGKIHDESTEWQGVARLFPAQKDVYGNQVLLKKADIPQIELPTFIPGKHTINVFFQYKKYTFLYGRRIDLLDGKEEVVHTAGIKYRL